MIRQYELIDKVLKYNPKADVALLNRAYVFSMKAHGNQKRASGQPYLAHPLEVAAILADMKLDEASIATGLLHDTLEDTLASYEELENLFGEDIASLTEGVTKLSRIEFNDKATAQAENFRKLLLAMSQDIRVLLIKLADRLHNMRTLEYVSKVEKRKRIAKETMDIFVPLADRIGLYGLKSELEDLSFQSIDLLEYEKIEARMAEWRAQDNLVNRVMDSLKEELAKAEIEASVTGREKTIYSVHRKMQRKNLTFDQLTDIVAYRIIVKNKRDCYAVLGLMHDVFRAIPGRFKDYISAPKPNGYQSLHTSVIGPFGNRMEVQIRTEEMHAIAESGVAAHWLYKENRVETQESESHEGSQYKWLRQLMEHLQGLDDPQEFYENAKLELFSENVFVFTPQGDLLALPQGATPLDFAYHIHSDIGNRCQAVRVNGRVLPLRSRLENGDTIEIITSKGQKPNPGWKEFVVTAKAKTAINRFIRSQEREAQLRLGREILEKTSRRDGYPIATDKELSKVVEPLKQDDIEGLFVALAQGRAFPRQIFDILYPEQEKTQVEQEEDKLNNLHSGTKNTDTAIGIEGVVQGMAIHMAKCCNPLPGEPIVGIITTGKGISIHQRDCRNLDALSDQPDRFLSVRWNDESQTEEGAAVYTARLRMNLHHQPGTLSNVTTAVFNADANITDLHVENRSTDMYTLRCDVDVKNREHLEHVIVVLQNLSVVNSVDRVSG
ncbi:MAG: bifunctional (p)ppGpp synthetase/guanosine-3',5'-bis(diphosphate) 3'-pyrophosphohydrolase [Alphaproteobacteria bacterium]|nr:bifunctional (p)ppGpp synthetase/guanosine-3',5'-bis(diphosphate) 3'-pyrophosphohydrolase [Alphaproteobacteria bacterium]MDD9920387.1 bifunctional (p)ppGpp synthetase/guanosine-3',5'-bis(diphosphate) 3'-pyrophosphohydrolase [Alphaproteobacteria bacterium]